MIIFKHYAYSVCILFSITATPSGSAVSQKVQKYDQYFLMFRGVSDDTLLLHGPGVQKPAILLLHMSRCYFLAAAMSLGNLVTDSINGVVCPAAELSTFKVTVRSQVHGCRRTCPTEPLQEHHHEPCVSKRPSVFLSWRSESWPVTTNGDRLFNLKWPQSHVHLVWPSRMRAPARKSW